jgi:FtsZ-binding cell division protein ZapB
MTQLKMTIAEFKTRIEFLEKSVSDKDKIIEELKIENKVLKDQLGKKE